MKNILIECDNDLERAQARIKEIAKERELELSILVSRLDQAMQVPHLRKEIATLLAVIINLTKV